MGYLYLRLPFKTRLENPSLFYFKRYCVSAEEISLLLRILTKLFIIIIPAKAFARDNVITGVGLSVCLFVCYHDN